MGFRQLVNVSSDINPQASGKFSVRSGPRPESFQLAEARSRPRRLSQGGTSASLAIIRSVFDARWPRWNVGSVRRRA